MPKVGILSVAVLVALVQAPAPAPPGPATADLNPQQLQALVAPIALEPDAVVAQILPAATVPGDIAAADQWLRAHAHRKAADQAADIAEQDWDFSVRGLCEYPAVLQMLAGNPAWTKALGAAFLQRPADLMEAIQTLRGNAWKSGALHSTPAWQVVASGSGVITIVPASEDSISLPIYDPWTAFGGQLSPWFPWSGPPAAGPAATIGAASPVSLAAWLPYGWSLTGWVPDWNGHRVFFGRDVYLSRAVAPPLHAAPGTSSWPGYYPPVLPPGHAAPAPGRGGGGR